jgi:STE24 endopeptidase
LAEYLWRLLSGLRPLRIKAEKDRLTQLFEEVYNSYTTEEKKTKHTKKIKLFIEESMNINAYAFGRRTLVLTKGCIDLLSDESLKGLIAHELGHFHNRDGIWKLFTYVANLPLSLLMKILHKIDNSLSGGVIKFVFNIIFSFFRLIEFVGDLIIMHESRTREYEADQLALDWGYGGELANALIELYQISMEKPKSINEMLKATHPPITKRIEELETLLY